MPWLKSVRRDILGLTAIVALLGCNRSPNEWIANQTELRIFPMRKPATNKITRKIAGKAYGCGHGVIRNARTIEGLVESYKASQNIIKKGWNPLKSLLEGYRALDGIEAAVTRAVHAEDLVGKSYQKDWNSKPKRHGHQRRIKQDAILKAKRILSSKSNIETLKSCKAFADIFDFIKREFSGIPGLGPLYIYDTALRIGAFSKKLPKRVYLQAGALVGARALGLEVKSSPIPVSAFPISMQQLAAHEIEDFLCIYKDELKSL